MIKLYYLIYYTIGLKTGQQVQGNMKLGIPTPIDYDDIEMIKDTVVKKSLKDTNQATYINIVNIIPIGPPKAENPKGSHTVEVRIIENGKILKSHSDSTNSKAVAESVFFDCVAQIDETQTGQSMMNTDESDLE